MMLTRSIRWVRLVWSLLVIGLGVALALDAGRTLPALVRQYWPVVLLIWGVWELFNRWRSREDMWAGMDYGTGLYVIRHRRRRAGRWLPGLSLVALGVFFLLTNLDPLSGVWFGPLVLIGAGVVALFSSFSPPPKKDFIG